MYVDLCNGNIFAKKVTGRMATLNGWNCADINDD